MGTPRSPRYSWTQQIGTRPVRCGKRSGSSADFQRGDNCRFSPKAARPLSCPFRPFHVRPVAVSATIQHERRMKIVWQNLPVVASVALGIGVSEISQCVGLSKLIAVLFGIGATLIAVYAISLLKNVPAKRRLSCPPRPFRSRPVANIRICCPGRRRCYPHGMFSNHHFDRVQEIFAEQFQPNGIGLVYRKSSKGPAIRVSAAERDAFIAAFNRKLRLATWGILAATVLLIGILSALLPDDGSTEGQISIYASVFGIVGLFMLVYWSAWNEPMRQLGSGLVDQSQKMTVAARAMADKKTVGHLS